MKKLNVTVGRRSSKFRLDVETDPDGSVIVYLGIKASKEWRSSTLSRLDFCREIKAAYPTAMVFGEGVKHDFTKV